LPWRNGDYLRPGIFRWVGNPITWWCPDPRGIIERDDFHVSESLAKSIRKQPLEVTMDTAFQQVMQGCAAPGLSYRSGSGAVPAFGFDPICVLHRNTMGN
jgi:leucyl/phenylalanyl-tRNA--protein transferase